ncbi:MAG: hypothetical protein IPP77_05285 [Bacteroidetes bacterium]|nr:hypothetical protein [Bacteroidota bacterium]
MFPSHRRSLYPYTGIVFSASFLFLLTLSTSIFASADSTRNKNAIKPDFRIEREQSRIDLYDSELDGQVDLGDSIINAYANKTYFGLVDSIQQIIADRNISAGKIKNYNDQLYAQLLKVNSYSVYQIKRFDQSFRFMEGALHALNQNKLFPFLIKNVTQSLNLLAFVKEETGVDSFLIFASRSRPDLVFSNYNIYANKDYASRVIIGSAKMAPVTVKRYFNPGNPIFETLRKSDDTVIKAILDINEKFGRRSNAFTLLDDIVNGASTAEEADKTGADPRAYLRAMLRIRSKENPLAVHSLETELEIYALKFVRVLNDLHNEPDAKRFASIEDFTPEELYTLMVYSEEEIFTSTFNALFKRMMTKSANMSGHEFLESLGYNKFRTFIKMCASFGKLGEFLDSMSPLHKQMLMIKFASGLETYPDLSQAVQVADAFSSITDSLVLRILKATIRFEYLKLNAKNNQRGLIIYGLLSNLFVNHQPQGDNWFASISSQYALPPFDRIASEKLFGRDTISRWIIYFYDDEDGDASFATFLRSFADNKYTIADSGAYILLQSRTGLPVHIYANKPKHEYDGQEAIEKLFDQNKFEPNVMVHRGHSYYAYKTIEKIKESTQVFVLGSCGGYNSISSIIERSPDANIISSKQIGTMFVNNPMIRLLADHISSSHDLQWLTLWTQLEAKVKTTPLAYEGFLDYIPPHKNLGAIFIKTYNKMMEQVN